MREEQRSNASAKGNREKIEAAERENVEEARRDKKKRIWETRE